MSMVWADLINPAVPEHKSIQICLQRVSCFQSTIDDYSKDFFLPPDAVGLVQNSVHEFLRVYAELGHAADRRGDPLWICIVKFHKLWHMAHRAQYLCPRRGACFIDEDFVGVVKVIAQACSSGAQLHSTLGKLVEKYRWGKLMQ